MKISDEVLSVLSDLPRIVPSAIPLTFITLGFRRVKKMIYEEKLSGFDRKELVSYLLQNRIFIESLSDEEVKNYYKYFKIIHMNRVKANIKLSFALLFRRYREI